MDKQEKLLARLFRDTFIIFLLSAIASTLGNIIDGMITGNFLGTEAIAAFGLTMPYQRFTDIFPCVVALGMQILCSKSLGAGNLQECNEIFSLALTLAAGPGIAAYTIVTNFAGILETIPKALGSSVQMIGGILVGEQDRDSVRRLISFALKFALAINLPLSALLPLFAPIIAELYTENDPVTYQLAIDGIFLFALSLPIWSSAYIFQMFYQAYGRFKLVNVLAAAENFFLFICFPNHSG